MFQIVPDQDPPNPRKEFSNVSKMVCFHRRYNLGDEHDLKAENFASWDEVEDYLRAEYGAVVVVPMYLYDHSGLVLSASGFSYADPMGWDWGQVGLAYIDRETLDREFNGDSDTAYKAIVGEIECYSQYLSGDVWCVITDDDSLCGIYGYSEAEHMAEEMVTQ